MLLKRSFLHSFSIDSCSPTSLGVSRATSQVEPRNGELGSLGAKEQRVECSRHHSAFTYVPRRGSLVQSREHGGFDDEADQTRLLGLFINIP